MDLILWRHAEAVDGFPDMDRQLTEKGKKQAEKMAKWLKARLPENYRMLVSPSRRTQQTARALTDNFKTVKEISPGASFASVLAASGWPDAKGTVVVVGHQPTFGLVASMLLCGEEESWSVKKGAVWWFTNRTRLDETQTVLKAVMTAELCE